MLLWCLARRKKFKQKLVPVLSDGQKVVADKVHRHHTCVTPENVRAEETSVHARVRARHETCNARLKYVNVLSHSFLT